MNWLDDQMNGSGSNGASEESGYEVVEGGVTARCRSMDPSKKKVSKP